MNAAALIPDLVFWIDCDPKKAMKRIQTGTLRMSSSGKQEYFETTDIQKLVRQGFSNFSQKNWKFKAISQVNNRRADSQRRWIRRTRTSIKE